MKKRFIEQHNWRTEGRRPRRAASMTSRKRRITTGRLFQHPFEYGLHSQSGFWVRDRAGRSRRYGSVIPAISSPQLRKRPLAPLAPLPLDRL
jgi:hypothetical protein